MTDIAYSLLVSLHPCLLTGRCHAVPHSKRTRKVKSLNSSAGFYFLLFFGHFYFLVIYLVILFIYLFIYSVIYLFIYLFILTQVLESTCLFEPKYLTYLNVHNANRNV